MKHSEIDIAKIDILPGNVIYLTVKKGSEIDLDKAKRCVQHIDEMLDKSDIFRGGIFDLTGITYVDSDARDYLAKGEGTTGITAGIALVSNSILGKMIGNLALSLTSSYQKFPVKYFDSPIRAEHWVRTKMREAREQESSRNRVA